MPSQPTARSTRLLPSCGVFSPATQRAINSKLPEQGMVGPFPAILCICSMALCHCQMRPILDMACCPTHLS